MPTEPGVENVGRGRSGTKVLTRKVEEAVSAEEEFVKSRFRIVAKKRRNNSIVAEKRGGGGGGLFRGEW